MIIVLLLLISGALCASEDPTKNPMKKIFEQTRLQQQQERERAQKLVEESQDNGKEEEQEQPSSPGLSPIIKKPEGSSPFLKKRMLKYSEEEISTFKYWLPYIEKARETEIPNYNNHILLVNEKENVAHALPTSFFLLEARTLKELQPLIDQLHEAALLLDKNEKKDKKNLFIAKLSLLLKNIHEANNDQVEPASKLFRQGFLYHEMQDLIIQCNQQPTNLNLAKLCSGVKKIVLPVPPQVDWHKAAQDIRTV